MLYNSSQIIGQTIDGATSNITGSIFLTLMALIIFLIVIGVVFRLEFTWVLMFLTPIVITIIAYGESVGMGSEFNVIGVVLLIFLGIMLARNFFLDVR
jgi:hypothetical protein